LIRISIFAVALGLAACTTEPTLPPSGQPIVLSPATQGELAAYLQRVKVTRPGAFAVSPDGRSSFYTWCDDIYCATTNYSFPALQGCRSLAGTECLVLYVRNQPRVLSTKSSDAAPGGQHGSQQQQRIEWDNKDGR
jgi:hypothetical protein